MMIVTEIVRRMKIPQGRSGSRLASMPPLKVKHVAILICCSARTVARITLRSYLSRGAPFAVLISSAGTYGGLSEHNDR